MKRYNFYFPEQQIENLRKISKDTGISMAELIRRAIDNLIKDYVSNIQSQDNYRQQNESNSQ